MTTKTIRGETKSALRAGGRPCFRITTDQLDTQRDSVKQDGLTFRENLRVMFAHRYDALPVGRVVAIQRGAHWTDAEFEWFTGDEFIARVRNIYEQGGLDASVGMQVHKARPNEHDGYDILSARVVEVSLTAVPANEGAVALAKSLGGYASALRSHMDTPLGRGAHILDLDDDHVLELDGAELTDREIRAITPLIVRRDLRPLIDQAAREITMRLTGRID